MSAFLGPIHYWLYNKIQIQQDLVEEMMTLAEQKWEISLVEQANKQYGISERRPLEQVIDGMNIHGWLQGQVSNAEYKLAFVVMKLVNEDPTRLEVLQTLFEDKGRNRAIAAEKNLNAIELYKTITDTWLDGMPCDHAYLVIEQSADRVIFKRNTCVHEAYWKAVGGDVNYYYELRNAWIKGFLEQQQGCFKQVDEVTYRIEKENSHE